MSAFGNSSLGSSSSSGVGSGNQAFAWDTLLASAIDVASKDGTHDLKFAWESDFYKEIFQPGEQDSLLAWKNWLEPGLNVAGGDQASIVAAKVSGKRKADQIDVFFTCLFLYYKEV